MTPIERLIAAAEEMLSASDWSGGTSSGFQPGWSSRNREAREGLDAALGPFRSGGEEVSPSLILGDLRVSGPSTQRQVAERLGVEPGEVNTYFGRLWAIGKLDRDRDGFVWVYRARTNKIGE